MHLVNFCYPDDRFETELSELATTILANSWYSNRLDKRALLASEGHNLKEAHALDMFKDEGLAPDATKRVKSFLDRRRPAT